ncbi:efflux RND transporter permease subunit [Caldifermentibacillus hisashii]|uniref:efflux RND transporter permease subunit n=1 Tax=Caldifermentibacillus hisashii TaxID=996558 RepID=UPI002E221DFA|nr:efflux RND transporter permease subunit [Caldifermentibacillus hisashii]MED4850759.1 efflux RND transporter permease subunit [Caldifermentibacillus hisashii]
MSRITQWSLKNGIAIFLLCILVLGGGLFATTKIQKSIMPDLSYPTLFVQIAVPGQAAEETQKNITVPLEEKILATNEAENVIASTTSNMVTIEVQYPYGSDLDKANNKLEAIVNSVPLPEHADRQVLSIDHFLNSVYQVALTGDDRDKLQKKIIETIIPEIKKVNGVANVEVTGLKEKNLLIELNQEKALEKGIRLQTVRDALESKNMDIVVGTVENNGKTIPVDIQGSIQSVEDLQKLMIMSSQADAETTVVKLSDIATIKETEKEQAISRYNGEPAFVFTITKEKNANTVALTNKVENIFNKYQTKAKYEKYPILNYGKEIDTSISKLVKEGLFGALFTIIVIALFLRSFRATIISIISLPISILVTIMALDYIGYTLNVMTLGGLAVAIGRIVDDSIVVIENMYRWLEEKGKGLSRKDIAFRATKEVMTAIASSTFVTCIVFLPVAFVEGIIGEQFRPFALAVVISILTSLFVAIMLIPVLGKIFFNKIKPKENKGKLVSGYEKLLRLAIKRKGMVLTLSILLLIGSLSLVPFMGFSLIPAGSSTSLNISMILPAGTELEETDKFAKKVETYLEGKKEIDYSSAEVGKPADPLSLQKNDNEATFIVKLKKGFTADEEMNSLKTDLSNLVKTDIPEAEIKVEELSQAQGSPGNTVIIEMYGDDAMALEKASKQVENLLRQNSQLKNVKNEMNEAREKWSISFNDNATESNVDPSLLMGLINEQLVAVELVDYKIKDEMINVTIEYNKKIASKSGLEELKIPTSSGGKQLKEIAKVVETKTPIEINRENGKTLAKVTAQIKGNDILAESTKVQKDVEALKLPEGVSLKTGGANEEIVKEYTQMGISMVTAIVLVFLILCLTFNGLLTPIVILTSIFFVPIGSFGFLLIAGQPLSLSSLIGLLMLIGIVVTNAVVLLDRVENNRKRGMEVEEAIVEAGKIRFRPIIMTAVATICALIPLAMSSDIESVSAALISKGLAITVIGGLTTSTLLTLVFVPSLYRAVERFRRNKGSFQKENEL